MLSWLLPLILAGCGAPPPPQEIACEALPAGPLRLAGDAPFATFARAADRCGGISREVNIEGDVERRLIRNGMLPSEERTGLTVVVRLRVVEAGYGLEASFVGDNASCETTYGGSPRLREICEGARGTVAQSLVGIGAPAECLVGSIDDVTRLASQVGPWRAWDVTTDEQVSGSAVRDVLVALEALGIDAPVFPDAGQPVCEGLRVDSRDALDEAAARAVGAGALLPRATMSLDRVMLRTCASEAECKVLAPSGGDPLLDCPDVTPPDPADLAATPRADADAELLALALDGTMVAKQATYDRVAADLAAIRSASPSAADAHVAIAADATSILIDLEAASDATVAVTGAFPSPSCAARLPRFVNAGPIVGFQFLRFEGRLSAPAVTAAMSRIPGVIHAEPNSPVWLNVPAAPLCVKAEGEVWRYAVATGPGVEAWESRPGAAPKRIGSWRHGAAAPAWADQFATCGPRPPKPAG